MKFIKEFGLSVIWVFLFSCFTFMMMRHFHRISISTGPLDESIQDLKEIKKIIPERSSTAFVTNIHGDEASQEAYYRMQFGWCPRILSQDVAESDNIIYYRSANARDSQMTFLNHYDTLYRNATDSYTDEFTLMLLHKTKNR